MGDATVHVAGEAASRLLRCERVTVSVRLANTTQAVAAQTGKRDFAGMQRIFPFVLFCRWMNQQADTPLPSTQSGSQTRRSEQS